MFGSPFSFSPSSVASPSNKKEEGEKGGKEENEGEMYKKIVAREGEPVGKKNSLADALGKVNKQ